MSSGVTSKSYIELRHIPEPKLEVTINGKVYEIIQVRRRYGGDESDWKEIDLTILTSAQKKALVDSAKKTADLFGTLSGAPADLSTAHTLTLRFNKDPEFSPQPGDPLSVRLIKKMTWQPQPTVLKEIRYKTFQDGEEKTFKVYLDHYPPEDQKEVLEKTSHLAQQIDRLTQSQMSNPHTRKLKPQNANIPDPTAGLETAIVDAGAKNNKCAARSIATIMKEQEGDQRTVDEISAELIQQSHDKILHDGGFITKEDAKNNALIAAIVDYNRNREEEDKILYDQDDFEAARQAYTQKLQENDEEMLDSPFFWTLDRPTVILEKRNGFKVKQMINYTSFGKDIKNLTLEDLKKFNIILHMNYDKDKEPNHYQAIILKTDQELAALKQVLQENEHHHQSN